MPFSAAGEHAELRIPRRSLARRAIAREPRQLRTGLEDRLVLFVVRQREAEFFEDVFGGGDDKVLFLAEHLEGIGRWQISLLDFLRLQRLTDG